MTKTANIVQQAMESADQTLAAAQEQIAHDAVAEALAGGVPVFNTHSHNLRLKMDAEQETIRQAVEAIDAQITALNAERDDWMLAYSGISALHMAIQK